MTLEAPAAALAGISLGALSSAHCALMCGPVAMVGRAHGRGDRARAYFAGRIVTYTALGTLAGSVGAVLLATPWAAHVERALSLLLAGSLLWAAWRAVRKRQGTRFVKLGRAPRRARIAQVLAGLAEEPLLLGAATVLLPCAALFAAVSAAAATGSASSGAALMVGYGSVTGIAVVGLGGVLQRVLAGRGRRVVFAAVLVVGAVLTLMRPAASAGDHAASCPMHAGSAR